MTANNTDENRITDEQAAADANAEKLTYEKAMEQLKVLTAQRDKIQAAITAHKKYVQKLIGQM